MSDGSDRSDDSDGTILLKWLEGSDMTMESFMSDESNESNESDESDGSDGSDVSEGSDMSNGSGYGLFWRFGLDQVWLSQDTVQKK